MKQFTKVVMVTAISFLIMLVVLGTIYIYIPIYFYKRIFSILTILFLTLGLFFITVSVFLIIIYKKEKIFVFSPKTAVHILKLVYPLVLSMADFFHYDKKPINQFFIHMNNIFVNSMRLNGSSKDILILVPHCIQNSSCNIKITSDPTACKECGRCRVSDLSHLQKEYGIKLAVATGGTLARRVVREYAPKYIIAIACERDLISGILDVNNIPVYGILNECPNGPCINTTVDIKKVKDAIINYIS